MTQAQTSPASSGTASAKVIALADAKSDPLLKLVLEQLEDDQAQEVVTIDLEGKSSIADHMVIASGRSTRQVAAMAQKLAEKVKQEGFGPVKLEGLPAADWVLIDAGDVVVHIFRPEVRSFYNLERMWAFGDAPPVAGMA
ncbi:ribosome silencing factor [Qipengyuania citrea]|uniref:Ribosomal silencing factor RsfS n=1 Tax=Qipengyuania citrea TaxID=225971 RepID=A0ABY4U570_9SPHN|nr:ribosome silencing factor [Qipengyuania citrea]USA61257.1 ribosome silencing factor [Qipengyuania citrea]